MVLKFLACLLFMFALGCTSTHELGGGRYAVARAAEIRSPFGTNVVWTWLENCEGRTNPYYLTTDYSDCREVTKPTIASSQGQGGQMMQGAMMGMGMVGLGLVMPGTTATATGGTTTSSSAASSASGSGSFAGSTVVNGGIHTH